MDGYYLNNNASTHLKNWVDQVIYQADWLNIQDIHIDEIDSDFKDKNTWIKGSIAVFKMIINEIGDRSYQAMLVIPLSYLKQQTDFNLINISNLSEQLYLTPPSIFLIPKQSINFEKSIKNSEFHSELSEVLGLNVYYKAEKEDYEFARTLYVLNRL